MRDPRTRRAGVVVLALAACLLLGDDCDVDRDAVRERLAREAAERDMGPDVAGAVSADACVTLPEPMPVGLSLVNGATDRVLVANSEPAAVIPLSLATQPPSVATPGAVPTIPDDSNGDGSDDPALKLEGVVGDDPTVPPGLALATSTANEQVLFVSPTTAELVPLMVDGVSRTALSTAELVTPEDGAADSHGVLVTDPFTTSFTSGVAVSGSRAFVSTSNVADGAGTEDPVYAPGTVLVYSVDDTVFPPTIPDSTPQVIFTTRYNPTDVTPYTSPGGRSFVLISSTGALGVSNETRFGLAPSATEAGKAGAIEVIEVFAAADPALVAVIPLGESAPGFGKLTIDRLGWIGTIGSLVERRVLAVDLSVLDELPTDPPDEPVILDGSGAETDPVIDAPSLTITPIGGGPPNEACAGTVVATAWAAADRLLALEFCDGTVSSWQVSLRGSPSGNPNPFPPDRFSLRMELRAVAPLVAAGSGQLQAPLGMVVRPGTPGVSFTGPDIFLLVGLPEGALCGLASDLL